jgi:hypothetical protein
LLKRAVGRFVFALTFVEPELTGATWVSAPATARASVLAGVIRGTIAVLDRSGVSLCAGRWVDCALLLSTAEARSADALT